MTARSQFVASIGAHAAPEPLTIVSPGTPLDVTDTVTYFGTEPAQIEWLVPRFIARGGFTIVYGAPKAGKTTLVYHMAGALVRGGTFLGWQLPPTRVFLLDLEQPRRVTHFALERANAKHTNHIYYRGAPPGIGDVIATVQKLGIGLIVVDSLSRWLEVESENDNAEITRRLGPIARACQDADVSLLVIHHDRKSEGDHGRNMRGGSAYLQTCDTAIEVKRVSGADEMDPRREIRTVTRGELEPRFTIKLEAGQYVEEAAPSVQREQRIQEALAARPLTLVELADALGEKERTARDWIEPLTRRGAVVITGRGVRGDPVRYTIRDYSGEVAAGLSRNGGN